MEAKDSMRFRLRTGRRGASSVLAAVFLVIILVTLIPSLLFAVTTYGSSVLGEMSREKAKREELFSFPVLGALKLVRNGTTYVESLGIQNDGALTIRISTIYISGIYICDPSSIAGDCYIDPQSSLWIKLFPTIKIELNQTILDATWTVTTDRGNRIEASGSELLGSIQAYSNQMVICFWPLMIRLDIFEWRSGSGSWMSGLTIPSNLSNVTWRVLLSNIGDKEIEMSTQSSFTLISNDDSLSNAVPWYFDPESSNTVLKPGSYNFVCYSWDKSYEEIGKQRQSTAAFLKDTTCSTFLLFKGSFVELNGSRVLFSLTIPFESTRVTTGITPGIVHLTASPGNIRNDGISTSTITVTAKDAVGNPMNNSWVDFYTTTGRLSSTYAITDSTGKASINITSTIKSETAHVTAMLQGQGSTTSVCFTQADKVKISSALTTIRIGGTLDMIVKLLDENNVEVVQSGIILNVTISGAGSPDEWPFFMSDGWVWYQSAFVITDEDGLARIVLKPRNGIGDFTITAQSDGMLSDSINVSVIV